LVTVVSEPEAPYIPHTKSHPPHLLLGSYQRISPGLRHMYLYCNKASFYGEELLEPHITPKLEDHSLLAVSDCLFYITAATIHTGDLTSIHNQRTWHAMPWWQAPPFHRSIFLRCVKSQKTRGLKPGTLYPYTQVIYLQSDMFWLISHHEGWHQYHGMTLPTTGLESVPQIKDLYINKKCDCI